MLVIVILLIVIAAFTFNDLVPIYKNRQWKIFWIYAVIMVFHIYIAVLVRFNVEIPSPATPLKNLVILIVGKQGGQ